MPLSWGWSKRRRGFGADIQDQHPTDDRPLVSLVFHQDTLAVEVVKPAF